jgi:hypothetical protein
MQKAPPVAPRVDALADELPAKCPEHQKPIAKVFFAGEIWRDRDGALREGGHGYVSYRCGCKVELGNSAATGAVA